MRWVGWIGLGCALAGCAPDVHTFYTERGRAEPDDGSGPADDPGARPDLSGITVDTSDTDPYVVGFPATWPVQGRAMADLGLDRVEVDGRPAMVDRDGRFRADVPVTPGLRVVPITAHDRGEPAGSRKANRVLVVADFLPEGDMNGGAAAVALTDSILSAMVGDLSSRVAGLDIADQIRRRGELSDDGTCRLFVADASHGAPSLRIVVGAGGTLVVQIVIPGLRVDFYGHCSSFLFSSDVTGNMETSIVISTTLTPPAGDGCIVGFDHSPPVVDLVDFDVDVIGGGSLFQLLLTTIGGELSEGDAAERMRGEIAAQADTMLGDELAGITVLDSTETLALFDTSIDVHLCLTDLVSEGGQLLAVVGATAEGPGGTAAPGAPLLPGPRPAAAPGTLFLDANLVGQLLFSAWRAGAIDIEDAATIDAAVLGLLSPELRMLYPAGTPVNVAIEAMLPPVTRAAPADSGGDLMIEIGDLRLTLRVGDEVIFELGTSVSLTLDLVPAAGAPGALAPMLVDSSAQAWVLREPVADVPDDVIEGVVASQVADQASSLLGDTTISLPDLGGIIVPAGVMPDPGGRYLRVALGAP